MINDGINIFNVAKLRNKVFEKSEVMLYKLSDTSYAVKDGNVIITVYRRTLEKTETQRIFIKKDGLYRKEIGEKVKKYRKLGESILTRYLKKEPLNPLKINDDKIIKQFFEDYIYSDFNMNIELFKLKKLQKEIEKEIKIVEEDIKDRDLQNLNI